MHTVRPDQLPEVHERKVFPFKPSCPPSPAESRLSTGALSKHVSRTRSMPKKYLLTAHGIEFSQEPGPALRSTLRGAEAQGAGTSHLTKLDKTLRSHKYTDYHEFGHHCIENNVNPFLAHYRMPKWSTTSDMYGSHYRHPEQTYPRASKNRMPVFQINL
mmetsp:Transcript_52727/g.123310  ORF Transcript_52727/g.123310 Transcript_52727/m.123310 type:complete len:159 (+) Transcript_52727:63-539(+)|eukprot:1453618-Amphidinium_carterae.1